VLLLHEHRGQPPGKKTHARRRCEDGHVGGKKSLLTTEQKKSGLSLIFFVLHGRQRAWRVISSATKATDTWA
jgi:hypothetical protein